MNEPAQLLGKQEKRNSTLINILSIAIPLAVALMLGIRTKIPLGEWTTVLPHVIGVINSLTAILLLLGFYFIRNKQVNAHRVAMLAAFANAEDAGSEALSLYGDALTILFSFYRKPAYRHHALLGRALLKLGTCSEEQFWRPAAAFLNMAPDLGSKAIPLWVETLQLSAEQQRQLETERFHALR